MRRYLKLYLAFFKNCLIREMEFRIHFIFQNLIALAWALIVMLTFFFIYQNVNVVHGWTLEQMLLLTAVYFLIDRIFDSFFEINFTNFITIVNTGQLDLILTKPVSSQFFISLRQFSFSMLFSNFAMIAIIIYLVNRNFSPLSWFNLISFIILIICSVIITYALWFMTLMPVFWLGRVDNLQHLFRPVHQLCRIPTDLTGRFKFFLTFIFPLAFVATIPATSLFNQLNYSLLLFAVVISPLLLFLSHKLWRFCLKYYTSASS